MSTRASRLEWACSATGGRRCRAAHPLTPLRPHASIHKLGIHHSTYVVCAWCASPSPLSLPPRPISVGGPGYCTGGKGRPRPSAGQRRDNNTNFRPRVSGAHTHLAGWRLERRGAAGKGRASAGRRPEENEAGGAKYAPRTNGCATARALEIRRVFGNRCTTSNVMAPRHGLGLSGSLR